MSNPTAGCLEIDMGVNLVTRVRGFYVETRTFGAGDHDVQDGCVAPGTHRLLRFDFLSYNAGDADLVIGSPAARPDLFVWSAAHGHFHLKDFNEFLLFDATGGLATVGYKQAFCAIDIDRVSPSASASGRFHDCNSNQGISAGWADVYNSGLACQFIVVDTIPDGDYTLQSTTNTRHVVAEECYGDNTMWTGLRFQGGTVTQIDPPYIPEDRIPFNRSNIAAVEAGGRWKVSEGSHWLLDTGTSPWEAQRAVEIIQHYKLVSLCFVGRPRCWDVEPMMYWLADNGSAPRGHLAGEDCIPFDRDHLEVVEVGERWKIVDGTHWLLDFGPGQGNAIAALEIIRKHHFDQLCFVGRPGPSMTYFKQNGSEDVQVSRIDPRAIDAAIDHPAWRDDQAQVVQEISPTIDFSAAPSGDSANPRDTGPLTIEVRGPEGAASSTSTIIERHGITGLELGQESEIRLSRPATVVDLGLAHSGEPPRVRSFTGETQYIEAVADLGQRQVENLRLVGTEIDRVLVSCADGESLLSYVHIEWASRT